VQGVDYAYTLQGWLKGTNSSGLTSARDMGGDSQQGNVNQYFAKDATSFSLHYFDGDYTPLTGTIEWLSPLTWMEGQTPKHAALNLDRKDLWNGNIGSMWTNIANPGSDSPGDNWGMLGMVYRYDQLNRLIDAKGYNPNNFELEQNRWNTTSPEFTSYNNHFTYDANGNIENQQRSNQHGEIFENLLYQYDAAEIDRKQNRLYHVNELDQQYNSLYTSDIEDQGLMVYTNTQAGTHINEDNNYGYTAIGELERDRAEDIERIEWRVDSKISRIVRTDNSEKKSLEFE
jgi:hypothetical protein